MSRSVLQSLRNALRRQKVDAFIIPTKDEHNSEYICDHDKRREFITGFSGSAGTAVVTNDHSCLWVDGRYWIAAEKQVDTSLWKIMKSGHQGVPKIVDWLNKTMNNDSVVGIDPFLTSVGEYKNYLTKLKTKLKLLYKNPVDEVWTNQPQRPSNKIFIHSIEFTGEDSKSKINRVRKRLLKNNCYGLICTCLDQIAWLFNLRGADIDFNPVFYSYCILTQNEIYLFVDKGKLDPNVLGYLEELGVQTWPYNDMVEKVASISEKLIDIKDSINKLSVSKEDCNYAIFEKLSKKIIFASQSPIEIMKAKKNNKEIDGLRQCHIRDGAAKTAWLAWLENKAKMKDACITEISAADKLEEFRKSQTNFKSLSFESISAVGANAAIVHYKPDDKNNSALDFSKLYLIDSGAQYLDGTTDVTRTVHFATPSELEMKYFTAVLKGHIALAKSVFPKKTSGTCLDAFARQFLWNLGADYKHGTGHGVGSFLNVHEGPQYISVTKSEKASCGIEEGMVVSNEPGYYEEGNFGIRIESVMIAKKAQFKDCDDFLTFETLTMVPIQKKMIDVRELTDQEIAWLNDYHLQVEKNLEKLLAEDKQALMFLRTACSPITRDKVAE